MDTDLFDMICQQNPWLQNPAEPIIIDGKYIKRRQYNFLMNPEWDNLWTVLVGPRQAGKTTLGKHLCQQLLDQQRYQQLLYLNCDYLEIRHWLKSPLFLSDAADTFALKDYI